MGVPVARIHIKSCTKTYCGSANRNILLFFIIKKEIPNYCQPLFKNKKTKMKLSLVLVALAALTNSASASSTLLRGLKKEDKKNDKNNDKNNVAAAAADGDEFAGVAIAERHGCVTDWETEKANMPNPEITEYGNDGSLDCYADPVNGCGGGCCRTSRVYFVCDSDGMTLPSLPCICNSLTAIPPTNPPQPETLPAPAAPVDAMGNMTTTGVMGGNTTVASMNTTSTAISRNADLFD